MTIIDMGIRKSVKAGFTLVELMIVVAIVGILAVLAVYGVRQYIANAKTAEAKNSLGQIGRNAVSAFEGERTAPGVLTPTTSAGVARAMCGAASASVPASSAQIKGTRYQSTKDDWANPSDAANNAGFPCLRFEMTAPQHYMYAYTTTGDVGGEGSTFTATANGDLDGDGQLSAFTLNGKIQGARLVTAPSIGELSPYD